MSQGAIERLVTSYNSLPRAKKYRYTTLATNEFLQALDAVMEENGPQGLRIASDALGVTDHSVRQMLRRRPVKPSVALPWPTRQELQALLQAHDRIRERRLGGSQARPGTAEHAAMMTALRELSTRYPLEIVAVSAGIGLAEVRRFAPLPRSTALSTPATASSRTRPTTRRRRESA